MSRMKHSEMQPGYFYSKGWVRYVAAIERGFAFIIEPWGYAVITISALQQWAEQRHTPDDAKLRFAKDFAEIAEQMARPAPSTVVWKFGREYWPDHAVKMVS